MVRGRPNTSINSDIKTIQAEIQVMEQQSQASWIEHGYRDRLVDGQGNQTRHSIGHLGVHTTH